MREYVVHERIKCDICENDMYTDTNGATMQDVTLPNGTYLQSLVEVSAFYLGSKKTCLCKDCRKAILESALRCLEMT